MANSTGTPEIVPFRPEHTAGVSALARAEGWRTLADEARTARLCSAPGTIAVVAVHGDDVVGAANLITDGHHGYLTILVVAIGWRRHGVGRRLVSEAFRLSGAERIDLLSTPAADRFYESLPHQRFSGFRMYPE